MKWAEAEARIRILVIPGGRGVLVCDGVQRRRVTRNQAEKIVMRTGVETKQTKAITYAMIRHAFGVLQAKGSFDSRDFRGEFGSEYKAAPCRYSMTGGILVEIGAAILVLGRSGKGCHYVKPTQGAG